MSNLAYKLDEYFETAPALTPVTPALTVLSYGGGQDSHCLLLKYIYDPSFRARYAPGRFLCVMSDTNDEHKHTLSHVEKTRRLCEQHGIEFVFIQAHMGFHAPSWQGLREAYRRTSQIGSKTFSKTCTAQLKCDPIYRFLEHWLGVNYGVIVDRKTGFKEFHKRYGKIHMLIGIAKGEEKRMADPTKEPQVWKRQTIQTVYPLVDLGLDRAGCQSYIRSVGHEVPWPSNCRLCHYMSLQELLWLWRFERADYLAWAELEQAKLTKNCHMNEVEVTDKKGKTRIVNKNYGVWGNKTLPQVLEEAQAKYGHLSDDQLHDYKFSHGHCVQSKY